MKAETEIRISVNSKIKNITKMRKPEIGNYKNQKVRKIKS